MQSRGFAERARVDLSGYSHGVTRASSSSQDTVRTGPITRSFKQYNLQSHTQKLVEDRQKCLVQYLKKGIRRGKQYNLQSHTQKLVEDRQKCLVQYLKKGIRRGKVNPKLQRFKMKGCPYYRILGHIFNRSTAIGALAMPSSVNSSNSDEEQHLERALIDGTVHIDIETLLEVNAPLEAQLQNYQQPYVRISA
ncbi:hypothetical protein CJ030_MR2G028949 [Morella rubra]|uniref:Uncharacterized protein n=1 Tax=Morella rubra TaxID=262757 RepID=A0A6A1WDM8_9ROSI|nr:hypothetical protein CJ030_MR2G028949 [Morella rubra]